MMERKTQRELIKLLLRLSDTMRQLDFGDNEQRGLAVDILKIIRDKCQRSFSEKRRAYYASSLDELLQILIHTDWQSMGSVEYRQSVRWCRDIVLEITNVLRNEKEIKKEIVFLPYKASMWDSLESVWKAAYEDKENCNTYVIPIPYANRNPDGTVSKWHCERDEYPNYVPTLDWNEYSWAKLREMHPDVIFIHNPYDNYNAVTSIDSQYYSDCLKKCTDKLVYVPYAVEEEIQPGNEVAENAIEHRVLLPVFFYADLIIAQSEDMRQAWINILTRRTNMNNRAYWEKRILGLGSPKIDKVLTSKKEDFEIPEKWKKLIGNKKVILYITSIAPMLRNSDKVCAKLRYVFDTFRNRNDVVLWWRPHPLMKATFHSMRSQFEEEYLSLEKLYIEEGWGIFDDSTDLHRAICYSDACYGDPSSVMTLYKQTGKPVMYEQIAINTPSSMIVFCSAVAMSREGKIYFINSGHPDYLCNLDINTGFMECMQELPAAREDAQMFAAVGLLNDEILIAPRFSNECFLRYNLSTQFMEKLSCPSDVYGRGSDIAAFLLAFEWNDALYFLGCANGYIVKYTKSKGLEFHRSWYEEIKERLQLDRLILTREGYILDGESLYLTFCGTNYIAEIKLKTFEVVQIKQLPFGFRALGIDKAKEYFWILPQGTSEVIRWNHKKNEYTKISIEGECTEEPFCGVSCYHENVVLIPMYSESAYILDQEKEKFVPTNQYFSELSGPLGDMKMVFYARDEISGARIGQSVIHKDRMFVDFNGKVQSFPLNFPEMEQLRLQAKIFDHNPILYEGGSLSLPTYISNLSSFVGAQRVREKYGTKIYATLL